MLSPVPELRPTTIEDAALVADLDTLMEPDAPRDPVMMAFWWSHQRVSDRSQRLINTSDGVARMFVFAGHNGLDGDDSRGFGMVRALLHPDAWSDATFRALVEVGEAWLREEGAGVAVSRFREDRTRELGQIRAAGYEDERRMRAWKLDLVAGRDRLLETARQTSADMEREGVALVTLDRDTDPERWRKLYELDVETTNDIPMTVPEPVPTFDEWHRFWFENPAHKPEHFWIAREGDAIVGLSVIAYPPRRGNPWTSFTCTARAARGRGIARALKYASVKQAIELGAREVETQNDAENAPILHLNQEMGYRPAKSVIELHHKL
jgi:RimJ/RimL family protein N-acetyltransferase